MGMFKDLRDLMKMSKDYPRPSMAEGIAQAKEAMTQLQDLQGLSGPSALGADPNARAGTAVIKAVRDTGVTINENPQVEMDLSVTLSGITYETTHKQLVSRLQVGQVQPGATVNVRVDPNDQHKLVVV